MAQSRAFSYNAYSGLCWCKDKRLLIIQSILGSAGDKQAVDQGYHKISLSLALPSSKSMFSQPSKEKCTRNVMVASWHCTFS